MFKSLQEFFISKSEPANHTPTVESINLAAATLMFELIRSDGVIDEAEIRVMHDILSNHLDIPNQDIETMIDLARKTSEEAISFQGFTRIICDHWNNKERMKLLENLWTIALIDERIDAHERHFVRKIAGLLYLNEAEIIQAQEAAKLTLKHV